MAQDRILNIVEREALRLGFNRVVFSGHVDGADAYAVGVVGEDGEPTPTGLPTYITLKDGKTSVVDGKEGLELMFRL